MFVKINDDYFNTKYIECILNISGCDNKTGDMITRSRVCITGWNWSDCPIVEGKTPEEIVDDMFVQTYARV